MIRSTGKRIAINRRNLKSNVVEIGAKCRLRYQARIIKIQDGHEKAYDLRYGVEPIRLVGRNEQLHLVVVAGFGEEPLLLLTNALEGARDSQSLWWIAQIYLTRWKIEETFRPQPARATAFDPTVGITARLGSPTILRKLLPKTP